MSDSVQIEWKRLPMTKWAGYWTENGKKNHVATVLFKDGWKVWLDFGNGFQEMISPQIADSMEAKDVQMLAQLAWSERHDMEGSQ